MVNIEDRNIVFRSWKRYAKALAAEVRCLQQFLPKEQVEAGFRAFQKEAER